MASVKRAAKNISIVPSTDPGVLAPPRRLEGPFWRLWFATGISASGDGLATVAVPLLALTITRSPLLIAGITAINKASAAIAALPGGVVADRWDRRSVMVACNVVAGATLLALVAAMTFGLAELVMIYVVAAVLAACDVTYTLAVQGSLPDLVPSDRLALANGRLIAVEGAGEQFVGPACGGILFSLARRLPFFADGASFFVSALLVRKNLPRDPQRPGFMAHDNGGGTDDRLTGSAPEAVPVEIDGGASQPTSMRSRWASDFAQGVRVFCNERVLPLLAANVSSLAFCQNMIFALLVLYGKGTLHLTSTAYGFFVAVASLFGMVGAFFGGSLQRRFGPGPLIIGGTGCGRSQLCGAGLYSLSSDRRLCLRIARDWDCSGQRGVGHDPPARHPPRAVRPRRQRASAQRHRVWRCRRPSRRPHRLCVERARDDARRWPPTHDDARPPRTGATSQARGHPGWQPTLKAICGCTAAGASFLLLKP